MEPLNSHYYIFGPAWAERLNQIIHCAHFQPYPFCDYLCITERSLKATDFQLSETIFPGSQKRALTLAPVQPVAETNSPCLCVTWKGGISWNPLCLISAPGNPRPLWLTTLSHPIMGTLQWAVCWIGGWFDCLVRGHMPTERPLLGLHTFVWVCYPLLVIISALERLTLTVYWITLFINKIVTD